MSRRILFPNSPTEGALASLFWIVFVATFLLWPGCALFMTTAHVTSSTSWSGYFEGRTVSGSGNKDVSLGGGRGPKCATVQKETREGFLTVSISGGGETKSTGAPFGIVSVCGGAP